MKLLKKLATGQFAELGFRANEELTRRSERRHHAQSGDHFAPSNYAKLFKPEFLRENRLADGSIDFARALRNKSAKKFFAGFNSKDKFRDFVETNCPDSRDSILSYAQKILAGEFPVFNHGWFNIGDPPDWNLDSIMNIRAPEQFYADIDFLNPRVSGDAKIVWEPSRLQFVYDLGQAYALTGDERYARHFFDLLNHWNRRNRDYHGINFCSALEFAFRANSVAWGAYFFKDSTSLDQQAANDIYRLLYVSGRFLADHLSRYFSPNTHLLGEAYGLYLIGLLFPEFAYSESWRATGRRILQEELRRQVRSDGLHAEVSTCYHAYSLEFLFSALKLAERNFDKFEDSEHARVESMTLALGRLQLPSGLWPHIGDDDGGRLMFLSRTAPFDYRPLLNTALAAFGQSTPNMQIWPDAFWQNGPTVDANSKEVRFDNVAVGFPSSGILVARSKLLAAVFQGGPFGYRDCPHSHADHLHLDLSFNGEHLIIDPGTLCYTADIETRNLLRGSASHNGPRLIGGEFYDAADPFAWLVKPNCRLREYYVTKYFSSFSAGYRLQLPDGTTCNFERRVLQLNDVGWMINDRVACNRPQTVGWDLITPGRLENCGAFIAVVGLKNHLRIRSHPRIAEATMGERLISDDYGQAYVGNCLRVLCPIDQVLTLTHTVEAHSGIDLTPIADERYSDSGRSRKVPGGYVAFIESKAAGVSKGIDTDAHFGAIFVHDNGDVYAALCRATRLVMGNTIYFESESEVEFIEIVLKDKKLTISAPATAKIIPPKDMQYELVKLKSLV